MTGSMVAVVTGGSRGIGRAVAVRLARDGVAVVVGYGASPQAADEIVASVRLAGGSAVAVRADVADAAEVGACSNGRSQSSVVSTSWSPRPGS